MHSEGLARVQNMGIEAGSCPLDSSPQELLSLGATLSVLWPLPSLAHPRANGHSVREELSNPGALVGQGRLLELINRVSLLAGGPRSHANAMQGDRGLPALTRPLMEMGLAPPQ